MYCQSNLLTQSDPPPPLMCTHAACKTEFSVEGVAKKLKINAEKCVRLTDMLAVSIAAAPSTPATSNKL